MSDTTKTITPTVAELRRIALAESCYADCYSSNVHWVREHILKAAALTRWADEIEEHHKTLETEEYLNEGPQ
jgi:hypothetical protein